MTDVKMKLHLCKEPDKFKLQGRQAAQYDIN